LTNRSSFPSPPNHENNFFLFISILKIKSQVGTVVAIISAVAHSSGYDSPAKAAKRFITSRMTHNTVPAVHQTDNRSLCDVIKLRTQR
jgi:hypothetical protein